MPVRTVPLVHDDRLAAVRRARTGSGRHDGVVVRPPAVVRAGADRGAGSQECQGDQSADDDSLEFEPRASAKRIELSSRSEALPHVDVDPARMRQVLENLLANALQHTPAGGAVTIEVSARDDAVELAVSDTGPGISKDELGSAFDRYTRSSGAGGSGLGLAIAKSLVELHGGSIQAESPPGGGTTIRTRLPAIA